MKALIAMSGGVDSSVAALLMQEHERVGCTMRLFDAEENENKRPNTCCSLEDVEDARAVCYRLGIPYHVFNFTDDFEEKIIRKFVESYRRGITPNPCIDCNRYMKFDKLFYRARQLGCDCVVTGHYARIEEENGKYLLKKALDPSKDQSYVLYSMTQEQLAHTRFPLGGLTKDEVRRIAEENGFVNARKPDSQDICFVPDGDYASFIERYSGPMETGDFVTVDGEVLGRHKGISHYTIGQRKHLGISVGAPIYVVRINADDNTVVLGDESELFSTIAEVEDFNWIGGEAPEAPVRCKAKTRYRQTEQPAVAYPKEDGGVTVVFDEPIRAITPGQACVLYDGDVVLGGGVIIGC
ncbi:MAG: tRNA 2-thiouridine(34) synthase MnmA [Ruminococcus sp.]|nr:tRNA 2-thiouridine(34) synthase MnmA [Ruminococcus sp.]